MTKTYVLFLRYYDPTLLAPDVSSGERKIARAKNNCEDIGIFAKRVGSNFFLSDRRLAAEFRQSFAAVLHARTARDLQNFQSHGFGFCRGVRTRTGDLTHPMRAFYQLNYTPLRLHFTIF